MATDPVNPDPSAQHADPMIPADLAAAIRRLESAPAPDFSTLDRAILGEAHRRFARRRVFRRTAIALSAAAGLALASWAGLAILAPRPTAPTSLAAGPASTITILDAFTLARLLDAHAANLPAAWDANHDGVIDRKDVDALAHRAVKLSAAAPHASPSGGGA